MIFVFNLYMKHHGREIVCVIEWKLKMNVEKTKSMIIGKCRNKLNFILNDSVIENVTFYKYLGVFFHKNGNFTYRMKQLVQIAKRQYLHYAKRHYY